MTASFCSLIQIIIVSKPAFQSHNNAILCYIRAWCSVIKEINENIYQPNTGTRDRVPLYLLPGT